MQLIEKYFEENKHLPIKKSFLYDKRTEQLYIFSVWATYEIIVTEIHSRYSWIEAVGNEKHISKDEMRKIFWNDDPSLIFEEKYILDKVEAIGLMAKFIFDNDS